MRAELDRIEDFIPHYLTKERAEGLARELSKFKERESVSFYMKGYQDERLQGDGWLGFPVVNLQTCEVRKVKGVILSNTCDISPENSRDIEPKIIFAPLVSLANYERRLIEKGLPAEKVSGKLDSIRSQSVSSIFYFPPQPGESAEYIAPLDDIHSVPISHHGGDGLSGKLFTLSMVGFYLFLFKISVHFCRFHEGVDRS
ncbi:hypothetical protein [Guyparkeria sp. TX1]|uniref:hypothetical protein n=1 Tax=Guyparkeria sp. TX1 TaxID=3115001 RepID=UPI00397784F5